MSVQSNSDPDATQRATTDGQATAEEEHAEEEEEEEEEQAEANGISKDDAFHILQNPRRRAVLRYLAAHEEQARFEMRDIAEEVAAWEHKTTVPQLRSEERQRVYIALYQSHLPKLDEHDVIEYNQSRGLVETTELTPVLEPYLDDGLYADGDLTVPDTDPSERDGETAGLATAVSTLFGR